MRKLSILTSLLLFVAVSVFPVVSSAPTIEHTVQEKPGLVTVQDNTVMAVSPVYFPSSQVYSVIVDQETELNDLKEFIKNERPLLYRIIECESGWQNICNMRGCGRGMGLAQIIPETWNYLETKINIGNDTMNEIDNLKAALWLFDNVGTQPWGYPPDDPRGYIHGERWGSWECWGN